MLEEVLMIGDIKIFSTPVMLKCFGLGSCVGLFIKDRITGITGGAHIFLPNSSELNTMGEGTSAAESVELILQRMKAKGASLETCRAKIAGGASGTFQFNETGVRNTKEVVRALTRNKVFIAAMDVGGCTSRTVTFDTTSGNMKVRQLETMSTKIF